MPVIKILPHAELCPQGAELQAAAGSTICEVLLENHINIEHACDMSCACTTCHVIVREGFNSLNSRLSCQAIVAQQNLVVEIPKYTINHAKENH